VIVAVVAMRVVQTTVDQEIDVVAMGHLRVAAVVVLAGALHRGAMGRVGGVDLQHMLIVVAVVGRVQVAVVEVVHVAVVADARVAAVVAVDVPVLVVDVVAHLSSSLSRVSPRILIGWRQA
jgi:hypothetical protein